MLSQLEDQLAQLKQLVGAEWGAPRPTQRRLVSLRGKFPQLKALTEAELDEATRI
jgi:hypothetical protein